jgi:hypothetical protein
LGTPAGIPLAGTFGLASRSGDDFHSPVAAGATRGRGPRTGSPRGMRCWSARCLAACGWIYRPDASSWRHVDSYARAALHKNSSSLRSDQGNLGDYAKDSGRRRWERSFNSCRYREEESIQSSLSSISANHIATGSVGIVANAVENDWPRRFSELLAEPHSTDECVICWIVAYQDK